ncbi:MAG: hypothetical protein SFZ23_09500 [Planctomycetota bacterium]|nr:hypothetical protein [Planctomycetota bacterium]
MARAFTGRVVAGVALLSTLVAPPAQHLASAQSQTSVQAPRAPATSPDTAASETAPGEITPFERYLERRRLFPVLAAHLRDRFNRAERAEQRELGERLGRLYVRMLAQASDSKQRQEIESRARELLDRLPESDLSELKLELASANYLKAEAIMHQDQVRLATSEDREEAVRILRAVRAVFQDVGRDAHKRASELESKEERDTPDSRTPEFERRKREAERLRSAAKYHSGWSALHLAQATRDPQLALEAMEEFGWNLGSPGKVPLLERASAANFKFPHVARAAIGCALAQSLRGDDVGATRWLDAVEDSEHTPREIKDQIVEPRIRVLARAKRWADLTTAVREARQPATTQPAKPLPARLARLLAVVSLEALAQPSANERRESPSPAQQTPAQSRAAELAQALAQTALGDLVQLGEAGHVLDLVNTFGTMPLVAEGFVVTYVRGLQAYERARAQEQATGAAQGSGTLDSQADSQSAGRSTDPGVINRYREAADLLWSAAASADAEKFPTHRVSAIMRSAIASFRAGVLDDAVVRFQRVSEESADPEQRREALWYAVVALDQAVERGARSRIEERDRLALLFIKQHPTSDEAAKLLIRLRASQGISEEQAIEILLDVEPESPVYASARREASLLLYARFNRLRAARSADRDQAAVRFAAIAEEVLSLDRSIAFSSVVSGEDAPSGPGHGDSTSPPGTRAPGGPPAPGGASPGFSSETDRARSEQEAAKLAAQAAAQRMIDTIRRLAHALLESSTPDPARAQSALQALEELVARTGADVSGIRSELAYRRLQIAIALADLDSVRVQGDELRSALATAKGGREEQAYARAGARRVLEWSVERFRAQPENVERARELVVQASAAAREFELASDEEAAQLPLDAIDALAQASELLWIQEQSREALRRAMAIDRKLWTIGRPTQTSLTRLARLSEQTQDRDTALRAWQAVAARLEQGTEPWLEAIAEQARLLSDIDVERARTLLAQVRALFPKMPNAAWEDRFRALELRLAATPKPATPTPALPTPAVPAPTKDGGG